MIFKAVENKGHAYRTSYRLKGMGDFIFHLTPAPYYEKAEDAYIQQITKVVINRGGLSTDWNDSAKLPTEIIPLDRPYALWTGNIFRGIVVKRVGNKTVPVANAEIEVEYLNYDIVKNKYVNGPKIKTSNTALETQVIMTNKNGEFSYAFPKAGFWGFAALGSGEANTYKGKELSQDAVLWVQVTDLK